MTTPNPTPGVLRKSTLNTRFNIDYDWWQQSDEDLRTYLLSHLPETQRQQLANAPADQTVDFVDPQTGEVTPLDALQLAVRQAAQQPNFISPDASLVDNVFRAFLGNNNQPLTARELEELVGRPADVILKTIGGIRVYKGIRPHVGKPTPETA